VIHQRKRLPFGFESGDDAFSVHARLDNLQGDLSADRCFLFCHENYAAPAFADLLQ
jgi:hypothetical protein